MPIVSVSLNDRMLEALDKLRSEMGFSGRSEVIRAGARLLLADFKEKETLVGRIRGLLLLVHTHEAESFVTDIKHEFLDIIHTQLHNRFAEGKCLELFLLEGDAGRVREMTETFQKCEKIEQVRLILA